MMVLMFFFSCTEKKNIIVYYSRSGTTEKLALELYRHNIFADTMSIKLIEEYPQDFKATIERSKYERENNILPKLQNGKIDLNKYDTIFLGYPIWYGTFAPPIKSFINDNDSLAGHIVIPFATYGRGGFRNSIEDLKQSCPEATIKEGIGIASKLIHKVNDKVNQLYNNNSKTLCGGFSIEQEVDNEASLLFKQVVDSSLHIEPLSVSTQVVSGINYLFECIDTDGKDIEVKIYKPLPGQGQPQLTYIK